MTSTETTTPEAPEYYNPFTGASQSEPFIAADCDEDGYRIEASK